ncbi:MAG TPA: MraY family glycosyltransferase [Armatimonadota bacterium]|nr:MraY family glycosyltransferase [Armatimonadota bacterium]
MSGPTLILGAVGAAAVSLVLTPVAGWFAARIGAVDEPDERRAHERPTPSCGGIAIFIGFWIAVAATTWPLPRPMLALFVASSVLLIVSVIDDARGLSPILRLVVHFGLAAGLWWLGGIRIEGVTWPFGSEGPHYVALGVWSLPLTVLWIAVIVNALNWLDGMDGLAAGTAAIAAVPLTVLAFHMDSPNVACMGAALCGASVGFVRYNVKPARIFMGDAGAMFLGLILACMAVMGTPLKGAAVAMLAPVVVLGVPIYDVLSTMTKRLLSGKPVHIGDRGHVHHRLLGRGWSEDVVVLVLWMATALLGVVAMYLLR